MAAVDVVDAYVSALRRGGRRLAHAEWGITVPAEALAGEPLDVGLRVAEAAVAVRDYAVRARSEQPAPPAGGWLA